jgi:hypothetical protein
MGRAGEVFMSASTSLNLGPAREAAETEGRAPPGPSGFAAWRRQRQDSSAKADAASAAGEYDNPLVYVQEMQADLCVLTRYVARRSDRGFLRAGEGQNNTPNAPVPPPVCNEELADLLVADPAELVKDKKRLALLVQHTDQLSRYVQPANVTTIRLTCAYVGTSEHGTLPGSIRREARSVQKWMGAIAALGTIGLLVAVCLLVHAGNGRSIVKDLEQHRGALRAADAQVAAAWRELRPVPGAAEAPRQADAAACPPPDAPAPPALLAAACREQAEAMVRLDLTHERLRQWNGATDRLSELTPVRWVAPAFAVPAKLAPFWNTTELRTAGGLFALTGFVLPMLLGLVGACAFVYRRVNEKIETWTLEARDKWQSGLRVLLGLTLGGLIGALFTSGDAVKMEGVTLTLAAMAFFIGYAVQVVFTMLDAIIRPISDRVKTLFSPPKVAG